MDTDKQTLLFTDAQYDIFTNIEANGFEHANNFLEIAVGSLNDFIQTAGLTKEEATGRIDTLKTKFEALYKEIKDTVK